MVNCTSPSAINVLIVSRQSELTRRLEEGSNSGRADVNNSTDGPLRRQEISDGDHPLNVGKASVWNKYFQVNVLHLFMQTY